MPTASNPIARASCLIAMERVMGRVDYCWREQSKRTLNLAEHWFDRQRPQAAVILVFQSVRLSSNRHNTLPPLEMVVQGLFVLGMCATRHPCGKGTRHSCPPWPCVIAKAHDSSVVAPGSSTGCAETSGEGPLTTAMSTKQPEKVSRRTSITDHGNTVLQLAATGKPA